jgi:DNA repair protein RadC
MKDKSKTHMGHRERMRKRFANSGLSFSGFEEHEILEVLLYRCFKRKNTNEIAHWLLDEFGTLEGVMAASVEELCKVKFVGEKTAERLKFYGEMLRYFEEN